MAQKLTKSQKKYILRWMSYLQSAAQYLLEHNKSIEAQNYIEHEKLFGGFRIDLESPDNGKTMADWIRLQYEDCYLFLHDNGDIEYQYDPHHLYNEEEVIAYSYEGFIKSVKELKYIRTPGDSL